MITRDIPFTLRALDEVDIITCSTPAQVFTSTVNTTKSTVADLNTGTGVAGRIIDRLGDIINVERFYVAAPVATLTATRGSTEADRQLKVGIKLQHGSSSAGGDMADYSTQDQPAYRTYFSTARTTDMKNWDAAISTGVFRGSSNPAYYDIRGANQYLRVVAFAYKDKQTTESSGDEAARLAADIVFMGADEILPRQDYGPTSSSTTT